MNYRAAWGGVDGCKTTVMGSNMTVILHGCGQGNGNTAWLGTEITLILWVIL